MTSKENKGIKQWLKVHSKDDADSGMLKAIWEATGNYKSNLQFDEDKGFAQFQHKILTETTKTAANNTVRMSWQRSLWRIAASVAILIFSFFLVKNLIKRGEDLKEVVIEAGTKATLNLDDGSTVVLNEKSLLQYPEKFDEKERRVYLKGEAFFEIAKNEVAPFVVETGIAQIQVLGTSFNVKSEDGSSVEVFVKTGKVSVTIKGIEKTAELGPGDKLVYLINSLDVEVGKDVSEQSVAWNTGELRFRERPFRQIFSSIEQQFDVEITVQDPQLLNCEMTTSIKLGMNGLRKSLKALETACDIRITEEKPGKFLVAGKCCQ